MLQVLDLEKSYDTGRTTYPVLKGISFTVADGEFAAVMGSSGSGKTTLLNCISHYIPPDSGKVLLGDTDLNRLDDRRISQVRNKELGFVFQDFLLLDGLTVRQNILLPAIIGGLVCDSAEEQADHLCTIFGIEQIREKYPAEISGGEKQRTAVARALINHPQLILADEPTGNLDSRSGRAVIDTFLQARDALGATIFMVTHDSFAASFCDKVIILQDGRIWKELYAYEPNGTDGIPACREAGSGQGPAGQKSVSDGIPACREAGSGQGPAGQKSVSDGIPACREAGSGQGPAGQKSASDGISAGGRGVPGQAFGKRKERLAFQDELLDAIREMGR